MKSKTVEVPDELLELMSRSKLAAITGARPVQVALALQLFLTGDVSFARGAELAEFERSDFDELFDELGIAKVPYGLEDLEHDLARIGSLRDTPTTQ